MAHYLISILVDVSGSMSSFQTDLVDGINHFLDQQRNSHSTNTSILFSKFNHSYTKLFGSAPLATFPTVKSENLPTYGSTALNDALRHVIADTEKALAMEPQVTKVVVFVLTDGNDNSSRLCTEAQARTAILEKMGSEKWEFVLAGANQDAIATGARFGIPQEACISWSATGAALRAALNSVCQSTLRVRQGETRSFTANERAAAASSSSSSQTPPKSIASKLSKQTSPTTRSRSRSRSSSRSPSPAPTRKQSAGKRASPKKLSPKKSQAKRRAQPTTSSPWRRPRCGLRERDGLNSFHTLRSILTTH